MRDRLPPAGAATPRSPHARPPDATSRISSRCSAAAIAMCAITGALTASGSSSNYAWLEALVRMLTVAAPIAVGLFALHRPPFERFGALLIAAGCVWFLTTLAGAEDATLYSIGRIAQWVFEPLLIYLLLAFPTGRLDSRLDRALVWIAVVLVLILYLPTALLVEQLPGALAGGELRRRLSRRTRSCSADRSRPSSRTSCGRCGRSSRSLLFAAVAVRLAQRMRGATPPHAPRPRAGARRGVLPLRGLRRALLRRPRSRPTSQSHRGVGVAARPRGAADGGRLPRGPGALVGVHRPLDPAARGEAARAPHPGGSAARPRRGVRRSGAGDRVLAGRRRGPLGRCARAPGPLAVGGARTRRDGDRRRRPPASRRSSTTPRWRTTARSSTRRPRTR